ncbi:MAG: hypothetical protein OXS40_02820 [Gammaproteobacteria bacterium]|nr:hypothetical protein [Gammaproteobacteria bacterium]
MIYRVKGRLKEALVVELHRKLTDGSIKNQRPDGGEIYDAMNTAVIDENGETTWSMSCFCSTPLAHERETVFDLHFDDLKIESVPTRESYQGRSFMAYLERLSEQFPN